MGLADSLYKEKNMELIKLAKTLQDGDFKFEPGGSDNCYVYLQIMDRLSKKVCGRGCSGYASDRLEVAGGELYTPDGIHPVDTLEELSDRFFGDVFLPFDLGKGIYGVFLNRAVNYAFCEEDVQGLMEIFHAYEGDMELADYLPEHFVSTYNRGEHMDADMVKELWTYISAHGLMAELGFMEYAFPVTDESVIEHICFSALYFAYVFLSEAEDDGFTLKYSLFMSPALDAWFSYAGEHEVDRKDRERMNSLVDEVATWIKSDIPFCPDAPGKPFFLGSIDGFYDSYLADNGPDFGIYCARIYGILLEIKCLLEEYDKKYGYLRPADGREGEKHE